MSVEAAADRLPWLADEPASRPITRRRENPLPWAIAMMAVAAAGGLWLGERTVHRSGTPPVHPAQPSTTVRLPPAPAIQYPVAPQPEVRPALTPEVQPLPARQVRISLPAQPGPAPRRTVKLHKRSPAAPPTIFSPAPVSSPRRHLRSEIISPWNPRVVTGASGRLVQIGAFGSIHQAKRGWWFMVHDYSAMAHLPAVVRMTRNSKGRSFYRFDVGTTSQAHSEVLCQRMVRISLSCAVVGLPWKAKVER